MYFLDRDEAGRRLAGRLTSLRDRDPVVLGLPRGGVPVAARVAEALGAPLDICLVRKLGVPFQPELGMGAVGEDGVRVVNERVVRGAGVSPGELAAVEERERAVLAERAARYRGERPAEPLGGRTVVLVDDGVATGSTARAACRIVRARGAAHVVLAVPVAPPHWTSVLAGEADELVCLHTPVDFAAVGQFYANFAQTRDEEVVRALRDAARRTAADGPAGDGGAPPAPEPPRAGPVDTEVSLPAGGVRLGGHLTLPAGATGAVLFAHGSGSGRHSPRNRRVAAGLNGAGLGTLLLDLLTEAEAVDRSLVFATELLAERLAGATRWLLDRPGCGELAIGWFGASTGAGAALWAAGSPGSPCAAVVSRGGRPDLAAARLPAVTAPVLLVVGGADPRVLELNRWAQDRLRCPNRLLVVAGAGHLFAEPGALDQVTEAAAGWFTDHLAPR
ncbi:phosphoribosyltransferase family protein [Streptomyces clavuligerus]|nr:phosphoribosyltransferase family protein [Streptomyces clavuligerus]ANW16799.1 phosphoribosyl transferase [Streptomyces clavuligerus]AXU11329.1 phosphoribosyltransferase [Streptomyces clavuligerus]MBY6301136.1 phosphoribosyltransferase [Streptomyces clavuligerus]QCS04197.1 phosphoribosyl transferase [Streptomyces clavuligerus]QPJ96415.1 phosphoribosyltransferase [Streptomyces clavuligerus]